MTLCSSWSSEAETGMLHVVVFKEREIYVWLKSFSDPFKSIDESLMHFVSHAVSPSLIYSRNHPLAHLMSPLHSESLTQSQPDSNNQLFHLIRREKHIHLFITLLISSHPSAHLLQPSHCSSLTHQLTRWYNK